MSTLHLPWLELAVLVAWIAALAVGRDRDPDRRRARAILGASLVTAFCTGALVDFLAVGTFEAHDRWDLLEWLVGHDLLVVDELSAPLLPLTSLTFLLTILSTLRTATLRFSFPHALVTLGLTLATLTARDPLLLTVLLLAGSAVPLHEQLRKGRAVRLYGLHMGVFAALMVLGLVLRTSLPSAAPWAFSLALAVRVGLVPGHLWVLDLFERGSMGTSILFLTPMVGVHGFLRLVLPEAGPLLLDSLRVLSGVSAVYFAGTALVQPTARSFFACELLCHTALVLLGLSLGTTLGITGALSIWLSVGLALTGFGLTVRCVEARLGRLRLDTYHGLRSAMPALAAFFLVMGLASVGFPGTIGFVAGEILVEAAIDASGGLGTALVLVAALNGLAVLQGYFRIFAGPPHVSPVDLRSRRSERAAVLVLTLLVLGGGLFPQPGIASRRHAAEAFLVRRHPAGAPPPADLPASEPGPTSPSDH